MARLTYGTNMSLDGYIEDRDGSFDFSAPDDEFHAFVNDLYRDTGMHLYGRRLYETMAVWETDATLPAVSDLMADWAGIWQGADKIVYSTTLDATWTTRTRLERRFDAEAVRDLKSSASRDLLIGGAALAAHAFRVGLVDEVQLFVSPVAVGGGKPALPDFKVDLALVDEHRFSGGTVFLRYQVKRP